MEREAFMLVARVAVWPWLGAVLTMWLVTAMLFVELSRPDHGFRTEAACLGASLIAGYLTVASVRLCLARGALVFFHGFQLVDTLSLGRRWRINDIESVDMGASPLFHDRRDQILISLRTGKTERLSAMFSADVADQILARLEAGLKA